MGNRLPKPSNKWMVDKLVEHHNQFIKSENIEGAFRAIDRGFYYETQDGQAADPYDGNPWHSGNLHLSAPDIYAVVVEALNLKPGLSFLNLGSGTGYLSTIVGLLIGPNGLNHGIEIHSDVVKFANAKLDEFKRNSCAIYKFNFSEPVFVRGNCLNLNPEKKYDRIYLGAACQPEMELFMKKLLSLDGGILVMPYEGYLTRYIRSGENDWTTEKLQRVSFTMMVGHNDLILDHSNSNINNREMIEMPRSTAKSLKELCRVAIIQHLRTKTNISNPYLIHSDNIERRRSRRAMASRAMHRVELQRQADTIRAHKAAALASAQHKTDASRQSASSSRLGLEASRRCCRGIRGQHPMMQPALKSSPIRKQSDRNQTHYRNGGQKNPNTDGEPSTSRQLATTDESRSLSSSRVLTRSVSRRLRSSEPKAHPEIPNAISSSTATSAAQAGTSDQSRVGNTLNARGSFNTQIRSRSNRNSKTNFKFDCDSPQRSETVCAANCTRNLPSFNRNITHREPLFSSRLLMLGRLEANDREFVIADQGFEDLPQARSRLQSFAWNQLSALSRQPPNRSNLSVRLCCPMTARALNREVPNNGSRDNQYEVESDDESLAGGFARRFGQLIGQQEYLTDEEDADEINNNSSRTSSVELSWSTVSSDCESNVSHRWRDRSEAELELDSDDQAEIDDLEDDENDEDGDDDDDDDDQSSLGESWDSFLMDANGDNADTSDDDDGDYNDEQPNQTRRTSFELESEIGLDEEAPSSIDVNAMHEEHDLETDSPVSSRLRSSSALSQSNWLTENSSRCSRPAPGRSRADSSSGLERRCVESLKVRRRKCCTSSTGYETRRNTYQTSKVKHLCRVHRANSATSRARSSLVGSRINSREPVLSRVNIGRLDLHGRCSRSRTKRHVHKCRWHLKRQQQRRHICPIHHDSCHGSLSNSSTVDQMMRAASSCRYDHVSDSSSPRPNFLPNLLDESGLRTRLRSWFSLDRFGLIDSLRPSNLTVCNLGLENRSSNLRAREIPISLLEQRRQRYARIHGLPSTSNVTNRSGTATQANPITTKRKRQTSSSSSSDSSSLSASNSRPTSMPPTATRKYQVTRRLRMAGMHKTDCNCSCTRPRVNLDSSAPATSDDQQQHQSSANRCALRRNMSSHGSGEASQRPSYNFIDMPHTANDDADEEDSVECELRARTDARRHCCCETSHFCRKHKRSHRHRHFHHHIRRGTRSSGNVNADEASEAARPQQQQAISSGGRREEHQARRRVERRERRNSRRVSGLQLGQMEQRSVASNQISRNLDKNSQSKVQKKKRQNECEKYRTHISGYIRKLPIPKELRNFLNYERAL